MKATKVHPDCHASTAQPMQSKHYVVQKRLLSANWDVEAGMFCRWASVPAPALPVVDLVSKCRHIEVKAWGKN